MVLFIVFICVILIIVFDYLTSQKFLKNISCLSVRANDQDRTGDLILTMDVLYRLSYIGFLHCLCSTVPTTIGRATLA
jgi:hypothetical protein